MGWATSPAGSRCRSPIMGQGPAGAQRRDRAWRRQGRAPGIVTLSIEPSGLYYDHTIVVTTGRGQQRAALLRPGTPAQNSACPPRAADASTALAARAP